MNNQQVQSEQNKGMKIAQKISLIGLAILFIVIIAGLLSSPNSISTKTKNVVIVSTQGDTIKFRMKCPHCGWTDGATLTHSIPKGYTYENTALCRECYEKYPISISR